MIFRLKERERQLMDAIKNLSFDVRYMARKGFVIADSMEDIEIMQTAVSDQAVRLHRSGDSDGWKEHLVLGSRLRWMESEIRKRGGKPTFKQEVAFS